MKSAVKVNQSDHMTRARRPITMSIRRLRTHFWESTEELHECFCGWSKKNEWRPRSDRRSRYLDNPIPPPTSPTPPPPTAPYWNLSQSRLAIFKFDARARAADYRPMSSHGIYSFFFFFPFPFSFFFFFKEKRKQLWEKKEKALVMSMFCAGFRDGWWLMNFHTGLLQNDNFFLWIPLKDVKCIPWKSWLLQMNLWSVLRNSRK